MSDAATGREAMVRRVAPFLLVIAYCLVVWHGCVTNGYVWRDYPYVVANLSLRDPASAAAYLTDASTSVSPAWPDAQPFFSPVTRLSFLGDFLLSHGMDAGWRHTHSLLLHLINVVLVLLLARRFGLGPGAACLAALLFGVHPVQTEAVCWVVRRDALLATGFSLGALLGWITAQVRPFSLGRGFGVSVLFLAACLSNMQALALPALLVLASAAAPAGPGPRRHPWPMVITLVGVGALALLWRSAFLAGAPGVPDVRAATTDALRSIPRALELFLFPRILMADYARADAVSTAMALLSLGMGALLVLLAVRAWRIDRAAAAGVLWILAAMAATWVDRPADGFGEYRLYFAVVGLALAVSRLVSRLPIRSLAMAAVAVGLIVASSVRTVVRVLDWADDTRALNSVLDRASENWVVLRRLMESNFAAGEYEKVAILARGIMEQSDRDPTLPARVRTECWRYLGASCVATGGLTEGREYLAQALLDPSYGWTYVDLGMAEGMSGNREKAITLLEQAARLMPFEPLAHYNLGVALREAGRTLEAERAFRTAARYEWRTAEACRSLAAVLWKQPGRMDEVVSTYRRAIRLFPGDEIARYWLGRAEAGWTEATFMESGTNR